jgi:N-acetylglucosamine repressor
LLEKAFNYPILIDTSPIATTMAEKWFGGGLGVNNFITLRVRTGIGLGIVINGELYQGRGSGNVGTINNIYALDMDAECKSDTPRRLFDVASGQAILSLISKDCSEAKSPELFKIIDGDLSRITLDTIVAAANDKDPLCVSVLQDASRCWGRALARIIELLLPEKVIFTGAFAGLSEILCEPLRESLDETILKALRGKFDVEFSELGRLAGSLGAAAIVLRHCIHSL